jgi:hypothetical protein
MMGPSARFRGAQDRARSLGGRPQRALGSCGGPAARSSQPLVRRAIPTRRHVVPGRECNNDRDHIDRNHARALLMRSACVNTSNPSSGAIPISVIPAASAVRGASAVGADTAASMGVPIMAAFCTSSIEIRLDSTSHRCRAIDLPQQGARRLVERVVPSDIFTDQQLSTLPAGAVDDFPGEFLRGPRGRTPPSGPRGRRPHRRAAVNFDASHARDRCPRRAA